MTAPSEFGPSRVSISLNARVISCAKRVLSRFSGGFWSVMTKMLTWRSIDRFSYDFVMFAASAPKRKSPFTARNCGSGGELLLRVPTTIMPSQHFLQDLFEAKEQGSLSYVAD